MKRLLRRIEKAGRDIWRREEVSESEVGMTRV